jgi:hypothetical protein
MDEATFAMMRPGDEAFAIRFTVALAMELEQWDSMTEEGVPDQTSVGEGSDLPSSGAGSPEAPGVVARRRFCSDVANAVQPPLHPSRVRLHSVVAGSVVVSYDILPGVGVVPASAAVQLLASLSEPGSRLRAPDTLTSLISAPDASHVHFAPLRVALCADGTSWDVQCIGIVPPSQPPDGPDDGGGNNGRGGDLAVDGVSSGLGLAILLVCALLLLVGVGIAACVWYSRRRSSSRVHVHNANGTKEAVHVHAVQGRYLPEFARNQSSPSQQQKQKDVVHLKVLQPRLLHVAEAFAPSQQQQPTLKAGGWTFDDSSPQHHHRAGSANLPAVQVALDISDEPPAATSAGATTAGTDDADAHAHFVVHHSPPLSPNGALQELLGSLQPPLGFTSPRLLRDSISLAPSSPSSSQLLHQQHQQQQQQQQGNETFVAVKDDDAGEADGLSALGREVSEPGDLSSSSSRQQQQQQQLQQPHQAPQFADGTAASVIPRQGSLSSSSSGSSDGGVGGHVGGNAVKVDLPTRELARAIRLHNEQLHAQHRAQFDLLRQFQPETKTMTQQQQRR